MNPYLIIVYDTQPRTRIERNLIRLVVTAPIKPDAVCSMLCDIVHDYIDDGNKIPANIDGELFVKRHLSAIYHTMNRKKHPHIWLLDDYEKANGVREIDFLLSRRFVKVSFDDLKKRYAERYGHRLLSKQTVMLFVDMDGTMAEWRSTAAFEDLFEENYFLSLAPHEEIIDALSILDKWGIRLCILSAYLEDSAFALTEKRRWLNKHAPFIDRRIFCPTGTSKADAVIKYCGSLHSRCVLLDDYSANLHEWVKAGGTGIKLLNGVNGTKGTWKGSSISRFSPAQTIAEQIIEIINM